mmetsp:Transcript_4869/g.7094  ORF Transcript_4869/g.7094 Transcript_4869/m.7094 type:complete len:449 (-) Transcript_4869:69-1415(-)
MLNEYIFDSVEIEETATKGTYELIYRHGMTDNVKAQLYAQCRSLGGGETLFMEAIPSSETEGTTPTVIPSTSVNGVVLRAFERPRIISDGVYETVLQFSFDDIQTKGMQLENPLSSSLAEQERNNKAATTTAIQSFRFSFCVRLSLIVESDDTLISALTSNDGTPIPQYVMNFRETILSFQITFDGAFSAVEAYQLPTMIDAPQLEGDNITYSVSTFRCDENKNKITPDSTDFVVLQGQYVIICFQNSNYPAVSISDIDTLTLTIRNGATTITFVYTAVSAGNPSSGTIWDKDTMDCTRVDNIETCSIQVLLPQAFFTSVNAGSSISQTVTIEINGQVVVSSDKPVETKLVTLGVYDTPSNDFVYADWWVFIFVAVGLIVIFCCCCFCIFALCKRRRREEQEEQEEEERNVDTMLDYRKTKLSSSLEEEKDDDQTTVVMMTDQSSSKL